MAKAARERVLEHFGFGTLVSPCDSFYDLQARDVLGSAVDFGEYRGKVVLVVNVSPSDLAAEVNYREMRQLADAFCSLPGGPFRLLLLPCEQFQGAQRFAPLRWRKKQMDEAQLLAHAAQRGLLPPFTRMLARGDVNGPAAQALFTFLKVSVGDSSDIGGNFCKFLVAKDGRVFGRYCPPLRPALLQPAITKLLQEEAPAAQMHAAATRAETLP